MQPQVISQSVLRMLWSVASFLMPFCYLYTCTKTSHMTTNIVSTVGLMTERDAAPGY